MVFVKTPFKASARDTAEERTQREKESLKFLINEIFETDGSSDLFILIKNT